MHDGMDPFQVPSHYSLRRHILNDAFVNLLTAGWGYLLAYCKAQPAPERKGQALGASLANAPLQESCPLWSY